MCTNDTTATRIPTPQPVTTSARPLDTQLWDLLLKPGPLTAAEWAYIDACEREGGEDAASI